MTHSIPGDDKSFRSGEDKLSLLGLVEIDFRLSARTPSISIDCSLLLFGLGGTNSLSGLDGAEGEEFLRNSLAVVGFFFSLLFCVIRFLRTRESEEEALDEPD